MISNGEPTSLYPRHYVQLEICHYLRLQTLAEYQKQMSEDISAMPRCLLKCTQASPGSAAKWGKIGQRPMRGWASKPANFSWTRLLFTSKLLLLLLLAAVLSCLPLVAIIQQATWQIMFTFASGSVGSFLQGGFFSHAVSVVSCSHTVGKEDLEIFMLC